MKSCIKSIKKKKGNLCIVVGVGRNVEKVKLPIRNWGVAGIGGLAEIEVSGLKRQNVSYSQLVRCADRHTKQKEDASLLLG